MKIKLSNVKISKADDFVVEHIENNLPNLWAKFALKAPQPHVEADFNLDGTAFTKKVSGTGKIRYEIYYTLPQVMRFCCFNTLPSE